MENAEPLKIVTPRQERPGRRKADGTKSWRDVAPRWVLLAAITGLVFTVGWLYAKVEQADTLQMANLKASLDDAAAKAQSRLLERVAVTEEQQRQTNANVERLILRMDKRDEAIADLTTQIRLLTVQLRRSN